MNGSESNGMRVATVAVLALLGAALLMNTCAMDRLEKQVIRQTKAVETLAGGGSISGARTPVAGQATGSEAEPGTPSSVEATGWGGRRAAVLHVEGAVANAPLRPSDKPKPQGDWYVNRRSSPPSTLNYYATPRTNSASSRSSTTTCSMW